MHNVDERARWRGRRPRTSTGARSGIGARRRWQTPASTHATGAPARRPPGRADDAWTRVGASVILPLQKPAKPAWCLPRAGAPTHMRGLRRSAREGQIHGRHRRALLRSLHLDHRARAQLDRAEARGGRAGAKPGPARRALRGAAVGPRRGLGHGARDRARRALRGAG